MKITVLMENTAPKGLLKEWGLSLYIEYSGKTFLLDTGASGKFLKNMATIGLSPKNVDIGILSHGHYDHANGLKPFFKANDKAKFYLRETADGDYYGTFLKYFHDYIGIKKSVKKNFSNRIEYVRGDVELDKGVYLLPHKTLGLEANGERTHLYVKKNHHFSPDNFSHEQSLVFETDKGLVIFNSCSHGGADVIINEVASTFPDKSIYAILGGFHLFSSSEEYIRKFARRVKETGIQKVFTGHCTGLRAFNFLQQELGETIKYMTTGQVIEL